MFIVQQRDNVDPDDVEQVVATLVTPKDHLSNTQSSKNSKNEVVKMRLKFSFIQPCLVVMAHYEELINLNSVFI